MSKNITAVFYGEPGVGKSTFLTGSESPLYLTTDNNFAWLGLPDEQNIRLTSYAQAKTVFADIEAGKYPNNRTIVVDLIEDLYNWAVSEFCKRNKVEHIGDYGSYGKGYDIVRKDFFTEISKLISVDKNIIFLSHESSKDDTDKRGKVTTSYYPSSYIPLDKLWAPIEGQVRYFLRCYITYVEEEGKLVRKHMLSLIPKDNEYGISRGLDESTCPEDIELNWKDFCSIIGVSSIAKPTAPVEEKKPLKLKEKAVKVDPVKTEESKTPVEEPAKKEVKSLSETAPFVDKKEEVVEEKVQEKPAPAPVQEPKVVEETKTEVVDAPAKAEVKTEDLTPAQRLAAIKAKVAALKNKNN